MNYFTHGRRFIDKPYFLAGTAVPDWLGTVDRKVRVSRKRAMPFTQDSDQLVALVAKGIVQHHHDDRWFHQNRAFNEMCLSFTAEIRTYLPDDRGFRPSFLAHILVELLLDAHLIEQAPERIDAYYAVVNGLDPKEIQRAVNTMATKPTTELAGRITLFCQRRFLYDYAEDETLLKRLNNVMQRVKLSPLPSVLTDFFPHARQEVARRSTELLDENLTAL